MRSIILKLLVLLGSTGVFAAACGSTPHPTTKQLTDCALVDIGHTVPEVGTTLFGYVLQLLQAGKDGWRVALAKIGLDYGDKALACASKAARDALNASTPGVKAMRSPAAARADNFIAEQGWTYK